MKNKIVRRSVLKDIIARLGREGKKTVFTNGCFDILHVGHLRYLQQARSLGDCLIVALNTDEAVHRLKGPERPFVPELERAEMVAGLSCVDYVTLFDEPTPAEILAELRPSIHVKGGDYTLAQIPEARVVHSYGGEVVILPLVAGKSTSRLVSHVRSVAVGGGRSGGRVVGVVPARLASARLPNKPLLAICGRPMIQWVCERASQSKLLNEVVVATPDAEIAECVQSFDGQAMLTSPEHLSGTDRVSEVARMVEADVFVNIQGDEPLLDPASIDSLVRVMLDSPDVEMGSLMTPLSPGEEDDPAVVKVVTDQNGFALYFSRSLIPYPRNPGASRPMRHIGVYAYRRNFLIVLGSRPPTPLEQAESLEQLRVLESGGAIKMVEVPAGPGPSVDTPEDLERVRRIMEGAPC